VPAGACADDSVWTDSYGDTCEWYATNDPGCTYYAPAGSYHDYGQFENCKATCGMCTGVQACPAAPIVSSEGGVEKVHFCFPPEEQLMVCGLESDGTTVKRHVATAADFSLTRYDETSMDLTVSLTSKDEPDFQLLAHLSVSDLISPDPASLAAIPTPAFCTEWLTVEMLGAAAAGPAMELEQGRFCDFTSPTEEPCCAEQTYEAQDACLSAQATGARFCDHTSPAVEPCCAQTTYELQDSCLAAKGVSSTRKLTGAALDAVSRKIALHTLKEVHNAKGTAKTLFKAYKSEKERLVRRALIEYSVAAAVALLFALGALRYCNVRKSYVVASTDEEMLAEADVTAVTE
jgi:hypothetical protein